MKELIRTEALPLTYSAQNEYGLPVELSSGQIEELDGRRNQLRKVLTATFPETGLSGAIDPAPIRGRYAEDGFSTSPVACIPDTEEAVHTLKDILSYGMIDYGDEVQDIESSVTGFMGIALYNGELDAVLLTDSTKRIEKHRDPSFLTEYARIFLAHELAHSTVLSGQVVMLKLDQKGKVLGKISEGRVFGDMPKDRGDLSEEDYYNGSILEEGFAVLQASKTYRPVESHSTQNIPGVGTTTLPKSLLSRVEDRPTAVYDGKILAAIILKKLDKKYSGIIEAMERAAKNEMDKIEFIAKLNDKEPGMFDALNSAVHESTWKKVAIENGIKVW
jgi:hypothetical protein